MAEAAVLTSLGWLASPSMKLLFEKAFHYLDTGLDERRKILEATLLPRLSLAIEKAEKSPQKEKVEIWLKRLKDAYYEAEDAIDLFEYEQLKQKVKDDRKTLQLKMKNKAGTRLSSPSQFVPQQLKIALSKLKYALSVFSRKKIILKSCIDKLIKIAKEADEFRDLLEAQEGATSSDPDADRDTISQPPALVFGREEDRETIASWLTAEKPLNSEPGLSTMQQSIPIIAIMGRSGIGKTALAQYIYKCMEEQKHFDQPLWVHVPRIFKADDVIKNMIKTIKAEKGALHECNYDPSTPLEALSRETEIKMLGSKKFLLVLDDFWCDTQDFGEQWEKFISCLGSCLPESRILLTTQSATVKSKACINGLTEVTTYTLQDLEENQFLELFMHHAWPSGCSMQREKFEGVGYKIAAKLKGDPGAAKLVGRQLSEKIELKHWEEVAKKDWLGDNMKARIWSYKQLPIQLQRCFIFCSLFPKGTVLKIQILTVFWIAEGFIEPTDNQEDTMEEICDGYLRDLVSRFFVEQHATNGGGDVYLHDLFYDLAEQVRGDEFMILECANLKKNLLRNKMDNIRHIYLPAIMTKEIKDTICFMKNLCTLIVTPNTPISKAELQEIFKHSKKLRVVDIPGGVDCLPDSIGNLKHLRYLNICNSRPFKKLPGSICKLYHLQNLFLPLCESLPGNFCELISLRHLIINWESKYSISNVGRLASIQLLDHFVVRKEPGHELYQLENLNQLREEMCITGLENVVNKEDAVQANMQEKRHLEELEFAWNSNERAIDDFELLAALEPPPNIRRLTITRYRGNRFPTWFLQKDSLKYLTALLLQECNEVEEISSIDESFPCCKTVSLRDLERLQELPLLPLNLTSLILAGIPQLSFFSDDDLLGKQERNKSILEVLKQLKECLHLKCSQELVVEVLKEVMLFLHFVRERLEAAPGACTTDLQYEHILSGGASYESLCDQFVDVWVMGMQCHLERLLMNKNKKSELVLPSSLTSLWIESCSITNDALSSCIQSLVFLSKLTISKIQTITSLPSEEVFCALKNLQSLTIEKCYVLCSLGAIGASTSLTELKLESCLNLKASNEPLPSSLKKLKFQSCVNVDVILEKSHLPVLRDLTLHALKNEMEVLNVGSLCSLEELNIIGWRGHFEGLSLLASLHGLVVIPGPNYLSSPVDKCTSALEKVGVINPSQLKLLLSNETVSSIENLSIFNVGGDSLNDEVFSLLTSLRHLNLCGCEITHLLAYMKNLASLQYMYLQDCTEDLNLSELKDFTQNLRQLEIRNCPTLMKKLKKGGRPYHLRFREEVAVLTFLS